jgi:hypothetical protein
VYQADELAGTYWYLNYLAKTRVAHIERIKSFLVRAIDDARAQARQGGGAGQLKPEMEAQFARSLAFIRLSLLDAASTWELSDALSCLYAALGRLGLVSAPPRPYSTDRLRYELRMRPFAAIGLPALPTFDESARGTLQPEVPTVDLLRYAERAVAGARRGLEHVSRLPEGETFSIGSHARWLAGVKDSLKACIATSVAVSTVRRALDAAGGGEASDKTKLGIRVEVPTPDKAYHEWWIAPKIIPVR